MAPTLYAAMGAALLAITLGGPLGLSSAALAQANATSSDSGQASGQVEKTEAIASAKGAKVYCFMRNAGNTHKVSWEAAYALIKRQSDSLFKTSPQHAAVMITEAVVNNPSAYPDCGKYIGDLYVN